MIAKKPLLPIKQQRLFHTRALVTFPRNATIVRVQAADGIGILLPEPLVYAKALATVIARRASELALDFASEVSIAIAEQPQRIKEFQEEVRTVAQRELKGSQQGLLTASSSSRSNTISSSSGSGTSSSRSNGPADLDAVVDELRAEIAASRALLQQIRTSSQPSSSSTSSSSSSR